MIDQRYHSCQAGLSAPTAAAATGLVLAALLLMGVGPAAADKWTTKGFFEGSCYEWQWQGTSPSCAHGDYCDGTWEYVYSDDGMDCCNGGKRQALGCKAWSNRCNSDVYEAPGPTETTPYFGVICLSGRKSLCRRPATGCTM